jgi:hypothetical protein
MSEKICEVNLVLSSPLSLMLKCIAVGGMRIWIYASPSMLLNRVLLCFMHRF